MPYAIHMPLCMVWYLHYYCIPYAISRGTNCAWD